MSASDSSRARSGSQPLFKSAAIGADSLGQGAGLGQVRLEVLGEPLVQPERQVAIGAAEQGVGGLVPQVFLEPRAGVGVDDSLVPWARKNARRCGSSG